MSNPNILPSPDSITASIVSHIDELLDNEHSFTYERTMLLSTDSNDTMPCQETGCYRVVTIETGEGDYKKSINSVWYLSRTKEPDGDVYRVSTGFESGYVGVWAVDAQKKLLIAMYLGFLENDEHLPLYDSTHDLHFGVVDHSEQLYAFENVIQQSKLIDYSDTKPMASKIARRILGRLGRLTVKGMDE